MKTFIYSKQESAWNKRSGSRTLTFNVYQLKNNTPIHIGETLASSGSYRGDASHVMNFIIEQKQLPKKYYGYYSERGINADFRIIGI